MNPKRPKGSRAAIYARCANATDGGTVQHQVDRCQRYADAVVHLFQAAPDIGDLPAVKA